MTFGEFVSIPEVRYVGVPVVASFAGLVFAVASRPRGFKVPRRDDWKVGVGWNISALIVWCTEAASAASHGRVPQGAWWTPLALLGLLGISLYVVLEWGWVRDATGKLKDPLVVAMPAIGWSLLFGALSLVVLYTQMRS